MQQVRAFENPFTAWLSSAKSEQQPENQHTSSHEGHIALQSSDVSVEIVDIHLYALHTEGDVVYQDDNGDGESVDESPRGEDDDTHAVPRDSVNDVSEDDERRFQDAQDARNDQATHEDAMRAMSADSDESHGVAARDTFIGDKRRLTPEAIAQPSDEQDAFTALAGIDLSPFHMHSADKAVLTRLLDWAYDRAAHLSRFRDGFVHAEGLGRLFSLALNPTDANVPDEYLELIEAAAEEMRTVQGLLDHEMAVPRGFISRGMPLRALQQLAQQLHEFHALRQRRRLTHAHMDGDVDSTRDNSEL